MKRRRVHVNGPIWDLKKKSFLNRGYSSVVERHLAKVHVARSTRVTRCLRKRFSHKQQWKGGRAVECIGFENRRSCETTGGSNPLLSEYMGFQRKKKFEVFSLSMENTLQ